MSNGYGLLSIRELWVLIRNRLGGPKILWVITDYGLSQVWVKAESTVNPFSGLHGVTGPGPSLSNP